MTAFAFRAKGLWLLLAAVLLGGCSTLGYYAQLVAGQAELLNRARPLSEALADPALKPATREALLDLAGARRFASRHLGLPDDGSYRDYADLGRPYAVWNVIATGPFSLTPRRWCFPVTGCVPYRGYFREAQARELAGKLAAEGQDVYVAGARAYSTLGWFDDPLLNTMLYRDRALRAEILFHELAHRRLYVVDDGAFNEAFASFVAQEGTRRWLRHSGAAPALQAAYRKRVKWRREFTALLRRARARLAAVYARELPEAAMREAKRAEFRRLREEYAAWRKRAGTAAWDAWMAQDLNNAHLALVGTYRDLVPGFARLLARCGNDLARFHRAVERLAGMDAEKRRDCLENGRCSM